MKNSDDSGYTGKHVGVCVLDTGIFPHIDFTGRILAFQDFIGHRIRPYDDNSHGTHVCGIIGGDGRASEGRIRGIAPGCSLIVLKVLDRTGNGRKEDVLQAFRWILENKRYYGIRVVNISVGTTCRRAEDHRVLIAGVEQLWDAGLVAGEVCELLRGLKERGKTILIAAHNMLEIEWLCDTICEMDAGVLTQIK